MTEIARRIKGGSVPTQRELDLILRAHSRTSVDPAQRLSKRRMMAFYLHERDARSPFWESLGLDAQADDAIVRLLRAKPRRTASGVATVTVLTKPWPCAFDCLYCPNDLRMPKSYISDEPACQRAERCWFDPYLQVAARLHTLADMGHNTDKVELIVLGGTWFDYSADYRLWFACQLFRALDEFESTAQQREVERRRALYTAADLDALQARIEALQAQVDAGHLTYAHAFAQLKPLRDAALPQIGDAFGWEELAALHAQNEEAQARCVGLVFETRPDTVSADTLTELRRMGATKLQVGVQALDGGILQQNGRTASVADVEHAFALMRLFGFKSHVHMMANLKGSTPEKDLAQYHLLMEDARYMPDEVKLYPCALVESARLTEGYDDGSWRPYSEEELVGLLGQCVLATPGHTRISRMIRDIPSNDILTGCKKTNLRQMVEQDVTRTHDAGDIAEMRMREVATGEVDVATLRLEELAYETTNTSERFLQWVDADGRLAGFLRLSLPQVPEVSDAMIREVHVYGRTSRIHESAEGNQHQGLGRQLVERACAIAHEAGYGAVNVISAVGTRTYYRALGFEDDGLYQKRVL